MQSHAPAPLAHSIPEAARMLGLSERSIFKMLDAGTLGRVKVGRRTLIPAADIRAVVGAE